MPYNELMIKPMREELTAAGVEELRSAEDVDRFLGAQEGTALLVVNSVCGCAAGMARPGVRQALGEGEQRGVSPDRAGTVFAGQDLEATAKARGYFPDIPPSSPCMAFFRDGELVYFMPRHRIEGRSADDVAGDLTAVFEEHCGVAAS